MVPCRADLGHVLPEAEPLAGPPPLIPSCQGAHFTWGQKKKTAKRKRNVLMTCRVPSRFRVSSACTRQGGRHPHLYVFLASTVLIAEACPGYLCARLHRAHRPQWVSVSSSAGFFVSLFYSGNFPNQKWGWREDRGGCALTSKPTHVRQSAGTQELEPGSRDS